MKLQLTGMRALVTGASRGVGYSVAELFAACGAQVVATARSEERLDQLARSVREAGGTIETIVGDLSTREGAREIARRCGDIDILVNNAANITPKQQTIITEEDAVWDMEFAVNLTAPVTLMQALVPAMMERKHGVVINISTVAARKINPMDPGYSAAKAGLEVATKAAAISLGSHGVRVNAIALGLTDTEVWDETLLHGITIGDLAKMAVPIERPTAVSEVAALCLFLASDAAPAITGSIITLDGGMTAGAFTPRASFAREPGLS